MSEMNDSSNPVSLVPPKSPREEVAGIPYLARMCDKIRLQANGDLHSDYLANLGRGFDQWTCQYLRVEYVDLVEKVHSGLTDKEVLEWAVSVGGARTPSECDWWLSYMRNRGYRDDLSETLTMRKSENGIEDRNDITSFYELIDADEGRI